MTRPVEADPRQLLLRAPMRSPQLQAIAITVLLSALDGFDVLTVSLAAPSIVREWDLSKTVMELIVSLGLAGMAAGSLIVAPLADWVGRRPIVVSCLTMMTLGSGLCAIARSPSGLAGWRVLTGLGIRGTLAIANPLAAEFANARRRDLAVALMSVGFPLGRMLGGALAARLLVLDHWRLVFASGARFGAVMLALVLWRLPEPISFLIERQRPLDLARVDRMLERCGHPPTVALPPPSTRSPRVRLAENFCPGALG